MYDMLFSEIIQVNDAGAQLNGRVSIIFFPYWFNKNNLLITHIMKYAQPGGFKKDLN